MDALNAAYGSNLGALTRESAKEVDAKIKKSVPLNLLVHMYNTNLLVDFVRAIAPSSLNVPYVPFVPPPPQPTKAEADRKKMRAMEAELKALRLLAAKPTKFSDEAAPLPAEDNIASDDEGEAADLSAAMDRI